MLQKDYILRMLEMLGDLIAGILGLLRKGELVQAEDKLERLYYDFLKEDASYFRKLPESRLTTDLLDRHNYSNGHLEILAELFNAEAELCLAKGDKAGVLENSRKSLILFEYIDMAYRTYSQDRIDKMDNLRRRIRVE